MEKAVDYRQALIDEVKELPDEAFPNLLQIVHLFKDSLLLHCQKTALALQQEFAEWGQLSDEALIEFERNL